MKLFSQNHSETSSRRFSSSQKKEKNRFQNLLPLISLKIFLPSSRKLNQLDSTIISRSSFRGEIGEFASCVVTRAYVHTTVVYTPQGIWKRESLDCYSIHVPLNLTYSLSLAERTVSLAPTTKRRVPPSTCRYSSRGSPSPRAAAVLPMPRQVDTSRNIPAAGFNRVKFVSRRWRSDPHGRGTDNKTRSLFALLIVFFYLPFLFLVSIVSFMVSFL